MSPDDPRHGTYAGSIGHYQTKTPSCQPCRDAAAAYRRKRRARLYLARTDTLSVPAIGSMRRLQALVALGHRMEDIDDQVGIARGGTSLFLRTRTPEQMIHAGTAERIAKAYARMCMTVPDYPLSVRARAYAVRRRWSVPLAWDDSTIDDPNARPHGNRFTSRLKTDIDDVAVQRAMAGTRLRLTKAERFEVVRQMRAAGWSLSRIEQHTGITKPERYIEREAS